MSNSATTRPRAAADSVFLADTLAGLSGDPKRLPCKYFYDRRGSQLFDAICEQPEYYLTRLELEIMQRYAKDMADALDSHVMLIEFGSGSSTKTHLLLEHLHLPATYVPVDISGEHLAITVRQLRSDYPDIEILPVCADFTRDISLPKSRQPLSHRAAYFPGSTIGNLQPPAAQELLEGIAKICGRGGGLLIGIDLQKDIDTIEAAYNDAAGVTAKFNLNMLGRINRDLGGEFDIDSFQHRARYDEIHHRVDIRLVSQRDQAVDVDGQTFQFEEGETIHTEFSHKYTIDTFADLANEAGFVLRASWTDSAEYFAVLHLIIP